MKQKQNEKVTSATLKMQKIKKIVVNYQELNGESQQHCTYF